MLQDQFWGVQSLVPGNKGVGLMSAREELARRVLQVLSSGEPVDPNDALQLRCWALTPQDALLPLREIALRIWGVYSTPVDCEERHRLNRI
jgi:hypothetical protein